MPKCFLHIALQLDLEPAAEERLVLSTECGLRGAVRRIFLFQNVVLSDTLEAAVEITSFVSFSEFGA
jgi:hypothetical protein